MLGRFAWTTRSGRVSRSPVGRMKVWCERVRLCAACLAVTVSVRFLSVACGGGSCVLVVSGVSVVLLRVRPCPSVSVRVAPPSRPRFCFPVNRSWVG